MGPLRVTDVDLTDDGARIRLGRDWLDLPEPFATLLAARSPKPADRRPPRQHLLFPGAMPGQHLTPTAVRAALKTIGAPALAGRTAAWRQLVRNAPAAVLAEALGVSSATAMRHANLAGADFLRYAPSAGRGLRAAKPTVG